ncbi:ketoacyl-ACP synthase III [Candidatus Sulfurimonas marisnigri]|uniref:Beta-ketoacyl-[acyl-carrier-protein] synthase III n=1 Tax=Candidatus Sulfurimonas marisnigri TaxID=2740405 RepID=A0A7S7RQ89_9BACT|nr:beta-ketoacyl-ACP synthase III [Candidatus Sulfurimonas marisnigri]QOY54298.1 ketoacyl-ACP synthase III [Candidatus Sulfurimonas marisnigri]
MAYAAFRSIGAYVPSKILTNEDLSTMVDTTDEWITKRTGIKERHIAAENEFTSDMGTFAAELAIERSGIAKGDIDMVICATISPDYFCMPSTATIIATKLGLGNVTSFDISAACTGFVYILSIAKAFIESGMKKNILIIGAEKLSAITDYTDRSTCILFGDGAGAAVISATENKDEAIIDVHTGSDGAYADLLMTPNGGSGSTHDSLSQEASSCFMQMKGNETFKVAVRTLTKDVVEILQENNIQSSQIKHFVPHQANYRIIKAVGDALKLKDEQVVLTVEKYGNTSGASIPMAINDIYEQGTLKKGELMLLDAFGGGLTWGSALVPFSPLK